MDVEFARVLVSVGSVPTVFPISGLTDNAVGFKTLADAIWLRNRVLRQLDVAQATSDPEERRRQLTFTFIGGGYAGVEALAELESMARDAVRRYQGLSAADLRWVLVEARDTLLPGLHPKLASFTEGVLRKRGVELYLGTRLESCVDKVVVLSGGAVEPYASETIVWTAGQRANPDVQGFGLPTDELGRVIVDDGTQVVGLPGVFAIGDAARVPVPEGGFAPMTAQHAVRQARVAAVNIAASLGVGPSDPFRVPQPRPRRHVGEVAGDGTGDAVHLHRAARLVDGALLPPAHDPRAGSQGTGGERLDDLAAVPAGCLPARPAGQADAPGTVPAGLITRAGLEHSPGGPRSLRPGSRGPVAG